VCFLVYAAIFLDAPNRELSPALKVRQMYVVLHVIQVLVRRNSQGPRHRVQSVWVVPKPLYEVGF
jgi:hypothetical protein